MHGFFIMTGIYKITNQLGQVYVGQSKDIDNRWRMYRSGLCQSQGKLFKSLITYGHINHVFNVIEQCEDYELLIREDFWQKHYKTRTQGGLNIERVLDFIMPNQDDDVVIINLETGIFYENVSQAAKSVGLKYNRLRAYLYGYRKNRTSLFIPGVTPNRYIPTVRSGPLKGMPSGSQKSGLGHTNNKKVESFNLINGKTIKKYYSCIQAKREDGYLESCIRAVAKGTKSSYKGLGWRYY